MCHYSSNSNRDLLVICRQRYKNIYRSLQCTGGTKLTQRHPFRGGGETVHQPIPSKQRCFPLFFSFIAPNPLFLYVIGGALMIMIVHVRHVLISLHLHSQDVKANMQVGLNEGLGYFQSEFIVDTRGRISTLVLLHLLRWQ